MTPPTRRAVDQERRRWNDQALDGLDDRVEDLENEREAIAGLPTRVSDLRDELKESVADLRTVGRDAAKLEERRFRTVYGQLEEVRREQSECRTEIRDLRDLIGSRFDAADRAHARVEKRQRGVDWATVLVVAGTITVPILGVLLAVFFK